MIAQPASYTAQLQAGLGMIPETIDLLRIWNPGMIPSKLSEEAISSGLFSRATARRARNIVSEMFAPRFLVNNGEPASRLKFLVNQRFPHESFVQLCFLYTARAQKIFADFVLEVYWQKYSAGASELSKSDSQAFIHRSLDSGLMKKRWLETTIKRMSGYLIGCCVDFGLVAQGTRISRPIQRFSIKQDVALYLIHDLRFAGLSDMTIVQHPDWQLFGLEPQEVITLIKNLSNEGHLLVQSSGDLISISWKYKTMEDCLNAVAQR